MNSRLILQVLKKGARATDILLGLIVNPSGFSYRALKRRALYPTLPHIKTSQHLKISVTNKNRFYSLLYQLKKQGFVEKRKIGRESHWSLTAQGEKRIKRLQNYIFLPRFQYKKEKDDGLNIIIFDIPEKQRAKRRWLRHILINLGFYLLQKSVWIGKTKLPEDFLRDLEELKLIDCVHIFKIFKLGSVRELNF